MMPKLREQPVINFLDLQQTNYSLPEFFPQLRTTEKKCR